MSSLHDGTDLGQTNFSSTATTGKVRVLGRVLHLPEGKKLYMAQYMHGGYHTQKVEAPEDMIKPFNDGLRVIYVRTLDEDRKRAGVVDGFTRCGAVVGFDLPEPLGNQVFPLDQFEYGPKPVKELPAHKV
jgi:hypothetical protein